LFLDTYKEIHPADTIEAMNLWKIDLPSAIGETLEARYAETKQQEWRANNAEAWQMIERYAEHFRSADKYLFTIPTWSFGIPYVLKEYIDVITQLGLLIEFTTDGVVKGLVADQPACVLYSRGGCAGPGSKRDAMTFQVSFMDGWLHHIGINHVINVIDESADVNLQHVRGPRDQSNNT
jgi:FMN-dependent NADH-azoreductase